MNDVDPFNLGRFVAAQAPVFETVLAELRAGRKRSHWMWFIFPQLRDLGRSPTAMFYGIDGIGEARAFLAHATLGPRLDLATAAALESGQRSLRTLFGSPDDLKFCSSMTLFDCAAGGGDTRFAAALRVFADGRRDERTLALLEEGREAGTATTPDR